MKEIQESFFLYQFLIQGIKCTGCTQKIFKFLKSNTNIIDIKINILAEKMFLSLKNGSNTDLELIISQIEELNFKIIDFPKKINYSLNENIREIKFLINENEWNNENQLKISEILKNIGVLNYSMNQNKNKKKLIIINYNEILISGRQIYDKMMEIKIDNLELFLPYIENFRLNRKKKINFFSDFKIILSLISIFLYIISILIIPIFDQSQNYLVFPISWNVFSLYMMLIFTYTNYIIFKLGFYYYSKAYQDFTNYRILNMETLIAIGSFSSFILGIILMMRYCIENNQFSNDLIDNIISNRKMQILMITEMFQSSLMILSIITIGKSLEDRCKITIMKMTSEIFHEDSFITNNKLNYCELKNKKYDILFEKEYDISLLEKNDLIKIEGQKRLLLDSIVLNSDLNNPLKVIDSINEGILEPKILNIGDKIKSGSEIISGKGILQIENNLEKSILFTTIKELNLAQSEFETSQKGLNLFFKNITKYFVIFILFLSSLDFLIWSILLFFDLIKINQFCIWCFPFERAISILVASCPCALGLAIPAVIITSLNIGIQRGILIKKTEIFDKIKHVNSVVFDKTGTLFTKYFTFDEILCFDDSVYDEIDFWTIINLIEKDSKHPFGEFMQKESYKKISNNKSNSKFVLLEKPIITKDGIKAKIKDTSDEINLAFESMIGNNKINEYLFISADLKKKIQQKENEGKSTIYFSILNNLKMIIFIDNSTNLRPEAISVITYLQKSLNKEVYLLSGDAFETVLKIGSTLNIPIENIVGGADPIQKQNFLKSLKKNNNNIMMIGDGLNDLLSLHEADIGISINSNSELNLKVADIIFLTQNLWKIPELFKLSDWTRFFIWMNLIWAFSYNIIIIPIAAGIFYNFGVNFPPFVSSIAMCCSSILVVGAANFLKFIKLDLLLNEEKTEEKNNLSTINIQEEFL